MVQRPNFYIMAAGGFNPLAGVLKPINVGWLHNQQPCSMLPCHKCPRISLHPRTTQEIMPRT
ncbi:hypothetical protein BSY18_4162 (plasmid) [Blastomonas sp. RAC04]|nr:hypothetical protein BSY18_4162 [Blastomonas sp. RAC04]